MAKKTVYPQITQIRQNYKGSETNSNDLNSKPLSFLQMSRFLSFLKSWMPAFAGMTNYDTVS